MNPLGCTIVPGEAAAARACGFDYVELPGKAVAAMEDDAFRNLRSELDRAGIRCMGVNAYCPAEIVIAGSGFDEKKTADYAQRLIPRLKQLGVGLVGIGSPMSRVLPDGYDRELAWRQAVLFYRITAEEMAEAGLRVCAEALATCYCNFLNRTEEAFRLAEETGMENVGVVLDFYNMEHMKEADGFPADPNLRKVFHAHISDDDGSPRRRDFLRPEKEQIHMNRVRGLVRAGYTGGITLETDLPLDRRKAENSLDILRNAVRNEKGG
ncbi:MAG: sugar phosphate isomerase/epimerase [Clostridia bacterium]|nr:sugar phosphate isomerase/epimerase [Clostridia bacterium]